MGWDQAFADVGVECKAPEATNTGHCRWYRRDLVLYTAFQERPLDEVGVSEAFRARYVHSLGAAVLVRVVRMNGRAFLVAKVLGHTGGPLGWITSRQLSDAEWSAIERAAAALPDGNRSYLEIHQPEKSHQPPGQLCGEYDGAGVRIERWQDGVLHISDGRYEWPSKTPCSGQCCDPKSEVLSRFFDSLANLVQCEKGE